MLYFPSILLRKRGISHVGIPCCCCEAPLSTRGLPHLPGRWGKGTGAVRRGKMQPFIRGREVCPRKLGYRILEDNDHSNRACRSTEIWQASNNRPGGFCNAVSLESSGPRIVSVERINPGFALRRYFDPLEGHPRYRTVRPLSKGTRFTYVR